MKKILSLLCIVALLVTVTACAKKKEEAVDRSGTTVAGKVTSINGSVVELTLRLTVGARQVKMAHRSN